MGGYSYIQWNVLIQVVGGVNRWDVSFSSLNVFWASLDTGRSLDEPIFCVYATCLHGAWSESRIQTPVLRRWRWWTDEWSEAWSEDEWTSSHPCPAGNRELNHTQMKRQCWWDSTAHGQWQWNKAEAHHQRTQEKAKASFSQKQHIITPPHH